MSGGGIGGILKMAAPIALSAMFPGVGSALAPSLMSAGLGTTAANALSSGLINAAVSGGIGALTGSQNPLQDALMGGAAGAAANYFGGVGNSPEEASGNPLDSAQDAPVALAPSAPTGMAAPVNQGGGIQQGSIPTPAPIPPAAPMELSPLPNSGTTSPMAEAQNGVPIESPAAAKPSTIQKVGNYISDNPLQSALIGATGLTALDYLMPHKKQGEDSESGYGDALPEYTIDTTETPYAGDWYTYGMAPQGPMIDRRIRRVKKGGRMTNPLAFAENGAVPGSGRGGHADDVPAMLSEDEYVVPAEAVSALGDGSSRAGGKRLDKMVENIRMHKTSRGKKFAPKAKNPLSYLKGA